MHHAARKVVPLIGLAAVAGLASLVTTLAGFSDTAGLGLLVGLALLAIPLGVWYAFGPYVDTRHPLD
jgi:hypothetical protein